MALEVHDAIGSFSLQLGLALLLRAEHGGHGGRRLFDDASGACAALRAWVVAGCLPSAARRGVDGVRAPVPLDKALPCAAKFATTGRRGFLGVARRVAAVTWQSCGASGTGALRRGTFGSVLCKASFGAPRGASSYLRARRTELRTDWRCSH